MVSLQVEMGVVFFNKTDFLRMNEFFLGKECRSKTKRTMVKDWKTIVFYGTINFNERTLLLNEQTEKMENERLFWKPTNSIYVER